MAYLYNGAKTFSITILSTTTLSITTFSITSLRKKGLYMTLSITGHSA